MITALFCYFNITWGIGVNSPVTNRFPSAKCVRLPGFVKIRILCLWVNFGCVAGLWMMYKVHCNPKHRKFHELHPNCSLTHATVTDELVHILVLLLLMRLFTYSYCFRWRACSHTRTTVAKELVHILVLLLLKSLFTYSCYCCWWACSHTRATVANEVVHILVLLSLKSMFTYSCYCCWWSCILSLMSLFTYSC